MMNLKSPRAILELLTNVALIVVSGLLVWSFTHAPGLWLGRPAAAGDTIAAGAQLTPPPGYAWASHSKTLILAIREGCVYCKDSVPLYRQLSDLRQKGNLRATLLAIMPDSPEAGSQFLTSNNIGVDGIYSLPLNNIKVSGTPTVLLVGDRGRIERAWVGKLPAAQEADLIAAVRK